MSVSLPLQEMTIEEKLQAMELLWDDLCKSPANVPSPDWHGEVLKAREQDAPTYTDWVTVKGQILKDY